MNLEDNLLTMLDEMVQVIMETTGASDYRELNYSGRCILDTLSSLKGEIIAHAADAELEQGKSV